MKWDEVMWGPQPSKFEEAPWIYFDTGADRTKRVGKWMVFCDFGDQLDRTWLRIVEATHRGQLGPSTKVATKAYRLGSASPIMVYTYDADDRPDVLRVLTGLRDLGIIQRLAYKEDAITEAGKYGKGVSRYVSPPDSREMEDRRPPSDVADDRDDHPEDPDPTLF